jgi:hypothetical protein
MLKNKTVKNARLSRYGSILTFMHVERICRACHLATAEIYAPLLFQRGAERTFQPWLATMRNNSNSSTAY